MPTYQYACTDCTHAFEKVQSFSDDALTECPECSGRLRKLFSAVGVVFKGSGFYRTDSRADRSGGASSGSGSSGSGSGSGSKETAGAGSSSGTSGSSASSSSGSSSTAASGGSAA